LADAYKSIEEGRLARDKVEGTSRFIVGKEGSLSTERVDAVKLPTEITDKDRQAMLRQNEALLAGIDVEEGRLARENRRVLKEAIKQEPAFENLDDARKAQLTTLLNALAKEENNNLPAPIRFARRQVKSILLRIKRQNPPS
jgi:hypothetical protein